MAEKSLLKDDTEELNALYNIRAEMHDFCQNEDNEFARTGILSAYDELLDDDALRDKINSGIEDYILKRLNVGNFDYEQVKVLDAEDRKRKQNNEASKTQNAEVNKIKKQLKDEIAYQASKGKAEFQGLENAEICSVSVDDKCFSIKISGRKEALRLNVYTAKGKHFSVCGIMKSRDKNFPYSGINEATYKLIAAKGAEGFALEEMDAPKDLGKRYAPADYRRLLGLESTAKLSAWQEKERAHLNKLSLNDQKTFIIELNKYLLRKKKFKEVIDFVKNKQNKISLLSEPEKLHEMLENLEVDDFIKSMQKQFVHHAQKNKNIWENFTSNNEYQQRFSRYEILQNNVISRNSALFSELYEDNNIEMKKKLRSAFTKIRHISESALPDGLCAEIMTLGIFKEGMKAPLSEQKTAKMNELLNEFGLNIAFKSLPVVKVPSAEISSASEQNKIDRMAFEALKSSTVYKEEEKAFAEMLEKQGIFETSSNSTHHYIALKYNGFVESELNDNANLVKTACENAWNYDGHKITHLFDTAGEFLVKNAKGEYFLADFNNLRNRFNAGEHLEIQAPILQVREENGKFKDLLALGEKGQSGQYISDNKTGQIISVPEYCRTEITPNIIHMAKLKSAKEEKA